MDGNFVSKSSIPSVSPQETFSCSLGVDPSIRITYHPQKKGASTTSGSVLPLGARKMDVTSYAQRISIKNTRPTTISRLIIKDQVPTSEDERIKVTVVEPSEKQMGPMGSSPASSSADQQASSRAVSRALTFSALDRGNGNSNSNGIVVARWAQKNEDGTGGPKGDGIIEWVCTDVGDELDINLSYEVSVPQGLRWS
jgi:hypothetical protein